MTDRCARPLPADALWRYWLDELEGNEPETIEDHAFECDACFDRYRGASRLLAGLRAMASAKPPTTITAAMLEDLKRAGRRVAEFSVGAREVIHGVIPADAEIAILRVRLDLRGVPSAEMRFCASDGTPFLVVPAAFDPDAGEVIVACDTRVAASYDTLRVQIAPAGSARGEEIADVTFIRERS